MFLKKIRKLKNTLFFRLTVFYSVVLIFLSGISFAVIYYRLYSVTMERMKLELLEEVEEFVDIMVEEGLEAVKNEVDSEAESEDPKEEFYRLIDLQGSTLVSTDMSSWGPVSKKEATQKLKNGPQEHLFQTIDVPGEGFQALMVSVNIGSNTIIQIGETFEETDEYLEIFRELFSVLTIVLIVLSATIGWFLAKHALMDMKEVSQTAEDIARGSYGRRVRIKGQLDEIKNLGLTFNNMLDCIQNLLKSMKEINDNIAHDLRSPLARIRGIAEMTLREEKPIDDYRNMAVNTIEECDVLIDMINTMLEITEAQAGVNNQKDEEFDVIHLISDACNLYRPMADEKNVTIRTDLPGRLRFRTDKKKMQRIVTNLLENSIKYTPEYGTVTIAASLETGLLQLNVQDTGIGIPEAELPHIFERFYRCDKSRSQEGVGLGLSLVKAYVESMKGLISVSSEVNQGSIFTLKFAQ